MLVNLPNLRPSPFTQAKNNVRPLPTTLLFEGSKLTRQAVLTDRPSQIDGTQVKIFIGRANPQLGQEVASYLGTECSKITLKTFPSQETYVKLEENVRGCDVFIIQPTCAPANDNMIELLLMIDAAKRANAKSISVILPYFGYARQDRRAEPREALAAKVMANMISNSGADRVALMELHSSQVEGFFDIPVDHLTALPLTSGYVALKGVPPENLVVVSPDIGGAKRAEKLAKELNTDLAVVRKERTAHNESEAYDIIGNVAGKEVVLVDDMIDTAGTLKGAAELLMERGAKRVMALATHGIMSGKALERLSQAPIDEVVVTNSIPLTPQTQGLDKISQITIAPIIGEAIARMHTGESVSEMAAWKARAGILPPAKQGAG
jgi:ribose-phosphate pyrophosphokinase